MFLSVFLLLISEVIANEESRGYLRREHSILKGEVKLFLLNLTNQSILKCNFLESQENFVKRNVTFWVSHFL